ncbi:PH domain-containing protein [Christiangramia flava]|uniref:PH domain-containing protein n=1 Tax=Christiangramia flava TaxID=1486245 RepID=UPI001302B870|nr:PH domain-containing protein [Christiangramia flava]
MAIITVTVADTFIKYYGLRLKKSNSGLQVEMGLRKNKKVSLKAKRVQAIEILNNPFQQRLNLQKIKFFLASSPNDPEKSITTIPGISQELLSKILGYMHVNPIKKQVTQIIPNKLLIFKKISAGFLPLLLIPIISKFYNLNLPLKWLIIIISVYSVILLGYQLLYFRSLRLSFSEEFILKNSGVWENKQQYLEIWKLQAVSISQPLWYRKKNLVTLTFHSAGGDVSFELIDRNKAESLMDYVLYKIESTSRGWM